MNVYKSKKDIKMTIPKKLYKDNEEIVIDIKHEAEEADKVIQNKPIVETVSTGENKLFENIKNIFTEEKLVTHNEVYFTTNKGAMEFKLDGTIFMPSNSVLLQPRKFEELYLNELESIIYNSKEQLDIDKLLPLIILFSYINKKNYPIRIVSGNYRKLLSKVCKVLNNFLNNNYTVIRSIYESFNSIKDSEAERNQQQIGD